MRRVAPALLAIALLGAPACGRGGDDPNGFRVRLDGRASVTTAKGTSTLSSGKHSLSAGDRLRMLEGSAVLDLPRDRHVLVRAGRRASVVRVANTPEIVDGDAVVEAGGTGARFVVGGVDVALAKGAARVQRRLSVTIAVYRGSARVRSAGRALQGGLPALRQVSISATGQVPRDPSPLLYDEAAPDPWDRQFLGDAIDLGRDLERRSRGLTGQLGPRIRVDATLLERVLPPLLGQPVPFQRVDGSSAGEAVVGAAIAVEARKNIATAFDEVFGFRAAGARWGLVALDQRVQRDALNARLDDAAGRSPVLFAASPNGTVARPRTTTPTTAPPTTGGGGPGPSTTTTTQPTSPTTVPTPLGPITVPVPPSDGGGDQPTPLDVVGALVDALLGQRQQGQGLLP